MAGQCQNLLTIAFAATLASAGGQASAQQAAQDNAQPNCRLVVEAGPDQWILNFDPFSAAAATQQFDLSIVNRGSGPCSAVTGVALRGESFGLETGGGGSPIAYALIDESDGTDLTPRAGESRRRVSRRPVNLGPGERAPLRFSLTVSPTELLDAGLLSQSAFITFEHPNGTPLAEKPVTLGVRVASAAMMGLKGEFQRNGGVATIDLGPLTEGRRSLNTALYVMSTSGYRVTVSSSNAGQLRQGNTDWQVPYTLIVGDRTLDLSTARDLDVTSTRARTDDYALGINILSVTGRRAGEYVDTLTFTVAAI